MPCRPRSRRPPPLDLIRTDLPFNPVDGWNVTYLPYCDGSLFAGDAQVDEDGDGEVDRIHAGLQNLSAALDVAKAQWPDPRRIVLAGSSGGGFGTIPGVVLVRELIGNVEGVVGDLEGANDSIENFVTLGHMEEVAVDGVTVADWLAAFVGGDDVGWGSKVE